MASSDALDHPSICVDIKVRSKVGASYSRDSPRKLMKGGGERRGGLSGREFVVYVV